MSNTLKPLSTRYDWIVSGTTDDELCASGSAPDLDAALAEGRRYRGLYDSPPVYPCRLTVDRVDTLLVEEDS